MVADDRSGIDDKTLFAKVWELSKSQQLDSGTFLRAKLRLQGRPDLASEPWTWQGIAVYPTLC